MNIWGLPYWGMGVELMLCWIRADILKSDGAWMKVEKDSVDGLMGVADRPSVGFW